MSYKVELTYFKTTGKYYSSGEYTSSLKYIFEIVEEIRVMFTQGKRPGLTDGPQRFITLLNFPDHPHNHPVLLLPKDAQIAIDLMEAHKPFPPEDVRKEYLSQ